MFTLGDVVASAEKLYAVAQKIRNAELSEAVAEFRLKLAQANNAIADLEDEKRVLLHHIKRLEQHENNTTDLRLSEKGNAYFRNPIREGEYNGPFCQRCKNPMIQDVHYPSQWRCLFCGLSVTISEREVQLGLGAKPR